MDHLPYSQIVFLWMSTWLNSRAYVFYVLCEPVQKVLAETWEKHPKCDCVESELLCRHSQATIKTSDIELANALQGAKSLFGEVCSNSEVQRRKLV